MDSMERKSKMINILIHIILILVSITMLIPFVWMILTAFKSVTEATSVNPFVIFPKVWRTDAFTSVMENMNFLILYKNTLLLILFRVICAVLTATLAGYAFGRLHFRGRDFCFSMVLHCMFHIHRTGIWMRTARTRNILPVLVNQRGKKQHQKPVSP